MPTTSPAHQVRLCAWRSAEVHARNGRTRPGDPDPCYAEIHWTDVHSRWAHVDSRLDADHKAVFGRADYRDDAQRGEALRLRYGIDGTPGDAQDVDHPFHSSADGWCVVCGLSAQHRRHSATAD